MKGSLSSPSQGSWHETMVSRKVVMASALLSLIEAGPFVKGSVPSPSQGVWHETMVSFLSVLVEIGWCGHGLYLSLL